MKIVAKVILKDTDGKILVLRRSNTHPHFSGHPDFPGGEVERGEDAAMATAREICEETGLTVDTSLLHKLFEKQVNDSLVHVLFAANLNDTMPAIIISWEHDNYEWLTANELVQRSAPKNPDGYYIDVIEWLSSGAGC